MIYLDNAATTYPKPKCVLEELDLANRNALNRGRGLYNVASIQSEYVDEARERILKFSKMQNSNVIFTPSSTIALNSVLLNLKYGINNNIYVSVFEHISIMRVLNNLKNKYQINIINIPLDPNTWEIDYPQLENLFALHNPTVICVSQISNVTGFIFPYKKLFELGKKYHSINLLDASQGFTLIDVIPENVDILVFAGHKSLYASFGIAGFIKKNNVELNHFIFGGTGSDTLNLNMPETGYGAYEAGSPNIVAIRGLLSACKWLEKNNVYEKDSKLTSYLIDELKKLNNIVIFIPKEYKNKIIGIVSIAVKGYMSDDVGKILADEYDICVRTGYHCAPMVHDFIGSKMYNGTVRISLGYFNTKNDIDILVKALKSL